MQREDWDRRYAAVENLWAQRPNRFLVSEVEGLEPARALDLACGEGQNAIWLAGLGWRVVGVDYSLVAIEKGRERAAREGVDVELVCADLLDFEPEQAAYGLVVILYLHVTKAELRTVLARAAGAVAPGGTFLFVGHDTLNLTEGVGGPQDPDLLSTPEEVAAELPGLEVVKAERLLRDVAGEERDAIDTLVRAVRPAERG